MADLALPAEFGMFLAGAPWSPPAIAYRRVGQEASAMDGSHFDTLVKALATTRLTRLHALRGLAAGAVAAIAGVDFSTDEAEAAKSGKCKSKPNECQTCKKGKCERKNGKKTCKNGKLKPKANGTLCSLGTCTNGACLAAGTPLTPEPPTCSDGVKNGHETDVDCGGPDCPPCAVGRGCLSRTDCASAICTGTCQACVPGDVCAAGGVCTCVLPTGAATTTCVALPAPAAIAGSCPGSCPAGTVCIGSTGSVLCTDPCTAP